MDIKTAIAEILHNATGKQAGGREYLVTPKRSFLEDKVATVLKQQWTSAGRDRARVMMRLSEDDGSNPHYVTGWNGKDTFVCMTETGLTYVDHRKLEKLKHDAEWNSETRLIEVRTPLLKENMERADVDMLLDRIRRTLTKSGKKRRKGRLRNMEKFFAAAIVDESKATASGPESVTEFEKVTEKDDRIPEEPKAPSTKKLPKDATSKQTYREDFAWDKLDAGGRPLRRGLTHPMMKESNQTSPQLDKREHVRMDDEGAGGAGGATHGGNKTDPQQKLRQLVRMNRESKRYLENLTDPQLDKRELVPVRKEGGGGGGSATAGGNKTDPQQNLRELVRTDRETSGSTVHSEERSVGAKDSSDKSDDPDYTTYAGDKAEKDPEFSSRPKITVRHEALGNAKAQKLFGPDAPKKAPGNKKPLLMLVLMGKKKSMSEMADMRTCPACGSSTKVGPGPIGMMGGLMPRPAKTKPGEAIKDVCPTCASNRREGGGALKLKVEMPKKGSKSTFESRYGRSRLKLAEGKKIPPAFLANIEKMKAKAKARKGGDQDQDLECA